MKHILKNLPLSLAIASMSLSASASDAIVVDAENFSATGGPYAGFNTYALGINHNQAGDWAEYSVELPYTGLYKLSLFAATPLSDANASVVIDGQELSAAILNTGAWDSFSEFVLAEELSLAQGLNNFRLASVGSASSWQWNASHIVFTPLQAANSAPLAEPDVAPKWALSASDIVVQVLNNDSDADADSLRVVAVEGSVSAQAGSVSFSDSSVIYRPTGSGAEPDSFSYTISDGEQTSTALVGIYYQPLNSPAEPGPYAVADFATTTEGEPVVISPLVNDFSLDGSSFSIVSAGMPAPAQHGSISVSGSTIIYTPNPGFIGSDSFAYSTGADIGIVQVEVNPANSAPVAEDDYVSWLAINPDPVVIHVLDNDVDFENDELRIVAAGDAVSPSYGTVSFTDTSVTISDRQGKADSFSYTVSDGEKTATALVGVYPFPTRPSEIPEVYALPDSVTTFVGEAVVIDVLANDFDRTGAELSVVSVAGSGAPNNGSLSTDGQRVIYTPEPGFVGRDVFTYSNGATASVTVDVVAKISTIEVEDFDATGGAFGGFSSFSLGDIGAVNHVQSGDWAAYSFTLEQAGTYTVRLYAGTTVNGANAKLSFNDSETITAAVPQNGDWDQFDEVVFETTVTLAAGENTLVLEAFGSPNSWEWNADRIELELN
ncbi:Ig-like domain-containing protein [Agaribacterium haliotis]|uniref:Ig-like domain-containing protein n=1 Tax=Agaribacterium haliotis TaxID=2013869 RepID=UPI000BB56773|nr:Ig-like domain-containing protein [Agaribacterium haliotis]